MLTAANPTTKFPQNTFLCFLDKGKIMSWDFAETLTPTEEMHEFLQVCEILHL